MWGLSEKAITNLDSGAPAGLLQLARNFASYPVSAAPVSTMAPQQLLALPEPPPLPVAFDFPSTDCVVDRTGGFFAVLDPSCEVEYLEQFRLLRTQLLLHRSRCGGPEAFRTVSVMSSEPGEGKTFTASNLACVLAGTAGQSVLLIDANPEGRILPVGAAADGPGLRTALEDPSTWRECLRRVPDSTLLVMPRGSVPASGRPWNLEPLPQLLSELAGYFEWVVLDGASFRTSPDAPWLASISDGTLLVVQQGAAGFSAVRDSLERIPGERLAGVVFNHQKPRPKPGFRLKLKIRR